MAAPTSTVSATTPPPAERSPATSPSPSRGRLSRALSLLGTKIATTLTSTPEDGVQLGREDESLLSGTDRSQSRGREAFSTGRGGVGNIRQGSLSRDARPDSGPDDFSNARGREPRVDHTKTFSTGRGGAGNIRSPSRDAPARSGADAKDQEIIRNHLKVDQNAIHSTGRGGIGNITGGDRSRSRARDSSSHVGSGTHTPVHSTGRGGVGNIFPGSASIEVESVKAHDEIHSTGRGGLANLTHLHAPGVEHTHHEHHHGAYESTGRGGAGNLIREE